jgi:uncharacterized membrane protein
MIAIRLLAVIPLVLAMVLLHAIPLLPRRSRLFGVDVPPEIRYGPEGSRLLRRYRFSLLPFTLGAALIIVFWTARPLLVVSGVAAACFAAVWLQFRYQSRAKRFALPAPSIREASLSDTGSFARRLSWFAPPLVLLAATALYLRSNWDRIPETFPVHFNLNGNPDGWSHRTVPGVFGVLVVGATISLFMTALYLVMDLGSRRATRRSVMLTALAAPCYLIAVLFSLAGLLPFVQPPAWVLLGLILGFLITYVLLMSHELAKPSDGPGDVTPDRCWHGTFYYNPDDPAIFVEARMGGFGYTANFARPLSWVLAALVFLFPLGLFLLVGKFVR